MLICIAKLVAEAGQEDFVRHNLHSLIQPSRAEAGCLSYDMHIDLKEPEVFMFYEVWRDQAAFDMHMQTEHLLNVLNTIKDALVETEVRYLEKVVL